MTRKQSGDFADYGCFTCIQLTDKRGSYRADQILVKDNRNFCEKHAPKGAKKLHDNQDS